MQFQSLQCSVCLHEYDLDNHLPRILPQCGHSVCGQCLVVLLGSNTPKCPLDNQSFPYQRKLDNFPVNFSLRGLIEEKTEIELCPLHEQKVEFFCHTDRCTLCAYCALYEGHRDHVIKPLKNVRTEITTKRKELETVLDNLNGYHKELNNLFDENKAALLGLLEDNFEHFISYAKKKKIELALEINSLFSKEKDRADHYIGKKSAAVNAIRSKILDVKEGLSDLETEQDKLLREFGVFDSRTFKRNLQDITQKLKEASNLFSNALAMQTNVLDHLEFSSKDLTEKLKTLYPQNIPDIIPNEPAKPQKEEIPSDSAEIRTLLKVSECDGYLQVKIESYSSEITRIKVDTLRKVKDFRLAINKQGLEEDELEDLHSICKEFRNLKCVKITTNNQDNSSQNYLSNLFKILFAHPQDMEEIDINLRYTMVTDGVIVPLAENFLSAMPKLKALQLYLRETGITDRTLEALAKRVLTQLQNIETLRLDVQSTNVTEKGVVQLFLEMPKVKVLELGLSDIPFTDKGLELFVHKTLKSTIRLEALEMYLYKTRITDKGINELFINLPNVNKLMLDFHSTGITDSSLRFFMQDKLPSLTALRLFTIELSRTKVSEKIKGDIWKITGSLSG